MSLKLLLLREKNSVVVVKLDFVQFKVLIDCIVCVVVENCKGKVKLLVYNLGNYMLIVIFRRMCSLLDGKEI